MLTLYLGRAGSVCITLNTMQFVWLSLLVMDFIFKNLTKVDIRVDFSGFMDFLTSKMSQGKLQWETSSGL